jgi:hypothetical protein
MAVFNSVEDATMAAIMDTVSVATKAGLTSQVVDDGHTLCAKPDTMELVDVFPDGSWEYQNVPANGKVESMSGTSAVMLSLYLHGDNKKLFEDEEG